MKPATCKSEEPASTEPPRAIITVYGDIAAIDVSDSATRGSRFGPWDNHITGVDLTNCPDLRLFNIHWNPISTIDLSQNTALEVFDLGYTNLQADLSNNKSLIYIAEAYSDGFDDPASGIRGFGSTGREQSAGTCI